MFCSQTCTDTGQVVPAQDVPVIDSFSHGVSPPGLPPSGRPLRLEAKAEKAVAPLVVALRRVRAVDHAAGEVLGLAEVSRGEVRVAQIERGAGAG